MNVIAEDTIILWIIPHLSDAKRGPKLCQAQKVSVVQAILYRLKTGTQWRYLPIKQFFDRSYSYQSVFHHFNQWVKDSSWRKVWTNLLKTNKHCLDLSSMQLDGSHSICKRGGEKVAY